MAMTLFAKKLSKKPIGTHVELTVLDDESTLKKITGVITDSDFTTSVEITDYEGEDQLVDYSLIKGFKETKSLEDILKGLTAGTKVCFSHGDPENREPDTSGTVEENDGEVSVEIITSRGEDLVLDYSIIRSLLITGGKKPVSAPASNPVPVPKPVPVPPSAPKRPSLLDDTPEDILNVNDKVLRDTFDLLPHGDRQRLSSVFERFKYGIKVNDKNKQSEAANQARQILYQEDDRKYRWSREAALFCGYLLRRVNIYDADVFLVGGCLEEGAFAAWKAEEFELAGVIAATALLENTELVSNMVIILAHSVVKTEDITGLRIFVKRMPEDKKSHLRMILEDACAAKNISLPSMDDPDAMLDAMKEKYPNTGMGSELLLWLPELPAPAPAQAETPDPEPQAPAKPECLYGVISRLNWSERTGIISGEDGVSYTFSYRTNSNDFADTALYRSIDNCMRSDLDGKVYPVTFRADKKAAKNIKQDLELIDRSRKIAEDKSRDDRYVAAFNLCRTALAATGNRKAVGDMVKLSGLIYDQTRETSYAQEALAAYESDPSKYPKNAFAVMGLAQAYAIVSKFPQMEEHIEKTMEYTDLTVKQQITRCFQSADLLRSYYAVSGDKGLLRKLLGYLDALMSTNGATINNDNSTRNLYLETLLHHRIFVECDLDMLDEAEEDYAKLPGWHPEKAELDEQMELLRDRVRPVIPVEEEEVVYEPVRPRQAREDEPEDIPDNNVVETTDEEYIDEEIVPYADNDGWSALKLTKKDVIDYALSITGPQRIPAILAYLRAGASLNPEILPLYRTVALATNDPMEAPDYSITALMNAMAGSDPDYPQLNDCCMGAAFLRTSFLSGRGYDYSTQGLRESIAISKQIPALWYAYDTLEQFRKETGHAIDLYANYRNRDAEKLTEDLEETIRKADELYTKFVQNPARDSSKFARLLETKKIVFARGGYLATMLSYIHDGNLEALEAEKDNFVKTYLNNVEQFSNQRISSDAIDRLIAESWDQAGNGMQMKKQNETLQGSRRNNLRSSISDVLGTICQWYAISEQRAGMNWRTEKGIAAYQRLYPQLMEQLEAINLDCLDELESCPDNEQATGLFLLAATARELSARMDGSWTFEQEKYLYVDFLRGRSIMLGDDFMPDLSSTFCKLPEFNVLARIRSHVENPVNTFQQQIDQIYGMEKTHNNYGTAKLILRYLDAIGDADAVTLPENAELFLSHTEMQIGMRYRSFLETYALAMNYGQIIKSDSFCYRLEDTVRYWYAVCKETKNYGFFTSILLQAENQIHASARQYETELNRQLDALIASNRQCFDEHPGYEEAFRSQIASQHFTVAEDWMSRIRIGDFSLEVQQPQSLEYLQQFLFKSPEIMKSVAYLRRPVSALLPRRVHNNEASGGQLLIDNWLNNGSPSNPERIRQLLNLLGWQNINVTEYPYASEYNAEIYEVNRMIRTTGLTAPKHPIAAFGSNLDKQPMYVVCLYGTYSCDTLYEKMRSLDDINGSKIILLDYAMGQADRRPLARKLKKRESSLRHVNLLIDRVLITYLSDNYNENLINRMVMATAMPFSYCQPYVVESIHTMPPEIFIGRRDELLKIEDAAGVNLIYGGRQLGKSALFKKAVSDLDGHKNQRAVLVDINGKDCAGAAKRLSEELIDLKILPEAEITDDWDVLCRNIKQRLRSEENKISYFLLMLDEADTFINDCANCGYRPLVALKDIQQSLDGQFKYVLAGLHNIIKFNRQVALGNNSVITHMPSLKITPFRTPEAEELLIEPLSYLGFSLPSKVTVSQIIATCNYFPGLIQLYAKKLIESVRAADYAGYDISKTPPYVVSDEHLRRVMADKEFVEQIHEKFNITLTLDEDQGSCYMPLALLIGYMYSEMPSTNGYTAADVLHYARDLSIRPLADLDIEKIDTLLTELQDLNVLRSVSSNSYLLASKNFRDLLGSDEEIVDKLSKFGGAAE